MSPVNFVKSEDLEIDFEKDVLPEELAFIGKQYMVLSLYLTLSKTLHPRAISHSDYLE